MLRCKIQFNPRLIAISLIPAYLIFFNACLNDSPRRIMPKAVKGVLDLRDWDFKSEGPVDLSGQWEFYWKQQLYPQDFTSKTAIRKPAFLLPLACLLSFCLRHSCLPFASQMP